ncbi:MAG: TetR/AcrR family transcriptional regulator [Lachnospiraceae bacterium]|nr:TetR/AcrR family transcriptional regulator [Lachnospiraceae bacterium]
MPNTKSNDYLKECIADAILVLIKDKPIEKITVDEIVKKAGVGRATYFRTFHSKAEAITFKFVKMWEQYAELNDLKVRDQFDINNALDFFEYNYSIRHILDIVYAAGLQEALHDSFYQIMMPPDHAHDFMRSYREKFYAHGLYGLLDEWIKREYQETPAEMAKILVEIVEH